MATFHQENQTVQNQNNADTINTTQPTESNRGPSKWVVLIVVPIVVALIGLAGVFISKSGNTVDVKKPDPVTTTVNQEVNDKATGVIHTGSGPINIKEEKDEK